MNAIKYSVIIPCSRPAGVQILLDALLRQTLPSNTYEIMIVVPYNTGKIPINDPRLRVIETTELLPPGHMRNRGAEGSRSEFLFFIDDDCIPPPDWLENMLKHMKADPKIGLVGCRVIGDPPTFWNRCADFALFPDAQSRKCACEGLISAAIVARRAAIDAAGGFDTGLRASEDWDLSMAVKVAGWKLLFAPDVEVLHRHGRGSPSAILRQAYRYGFASGLFVQRRYEQHLSLLGRLSLRFSHPLPYIFWMPLAAFMTSVVQAWNLRDADRELPLFFPMMFAARFAYQLGVWQRLFKDRNA
jgi:cellulose synthase/poly-beta-1,6-N-acetylglucosamine synthase-like glycosyltransferase